jgi:hypothetical protein
MTDALYKSLCYHCHIDDPAYSKKISLPYGLPPKNHDTANLLPFPPNDPNQGHRFEERVKALLRRHVVERCIYGVDINPLAVELARVSLWVETLDPELPFSFLDHKIKVGNSLVGCWLDRVEDYPLKAWEREGGDGKDGPRTLRIEEFLKGEKIGNRRSGDGRIKKEMRQVIDSKFSQQPRLFPGESTTTESVVALARAEYEQLHDLPIGDPDERERFYREHIERSQPLCTLTRAMDEWCAVWFWPTDEESLRHAPTPLTFHKPSVEKDALVERLAQGVKFFHWEMEFPDVFTPDRSGFDAMVGNPPWDVMKPNSQEFFTEFDPLYRTYDKQAALRKQKELFDNIADVAEQWDEYNGRFKALGNWAKNVAEPYDLALSRGKEGEGLASLWAKHRAKHVSYADAKHPFRLQGSADLNLYKIFTEVFWYLLRIDGRLGVILPTGIYSDFGTRDLRHTFLTCGKLDFLYAFQNERRVFLSAHHAMKQVVLTATKGGTTEQFKTRFRLGVGDSPEAHEIPDDLLHNSGAMVITPADVKQNSPTTLALLELRTKRDLQILRSMNSACVRVGDSDQGWQARYVAEFHMTNDSKHFATLEKWRSIGFQPDMFGRWIGPEDQRALPLYEGRMIGQFDLSRKGWISGKGRTAVWRDVPFSSKQIEPQFLVQEETYASWPKASHALKIGFMDVTSSTNSRTFVGAIIPDCPANHKTPTLLVASGNTSKTLLALAALNSFVFDYALRIRLSGLSLGWFILEECPVPPLSAGVRQYRMSVCVARLDFVHRRFAPEWLKLKEIYPELAERDWKFWWAVTEADRLRLRVEIDALCADLYGLKPDDFDWIVRDDPKDPKGFYRVDRQLPFRERLTGLAAAAFRALKEGKWSAESAAKLSNDEFFALIGIPELTTGPEPLIRKRTGCHIWKPEAFGPDDPRHGWTWDHCWQDAVALLGSEEAVQKYIEQKEEKTAEDEAPTNLDGQTDLFGQPLPPKQGRLF